MNRENIKHSVAFRVSESEWKKLKAIAAKRNTTVPQLAREALFQGLGINIPQRKRRPYGQLSAE